MPMPAPVTAHVIVWRASNNWPSGHRTIWKAPLPSPRRRSKAMTGKKPREALKDLISKRPTERVCTLMARIEGGEFGDKGRVREWLARAVRAPRDPSWTADGYISEHWAPVSPITGQLDAFVWKIPVEQLENKDEDTCRLRNLFPSRPRSRKKNKSKSAKPARRRKNWSPSRQAMSYLKSCNPVDEPAKERPELQNSIKTALMQQKPVSKMPKSCLNPEVTVEPSPIVTT